MPNLNQVLKAEIARVARKEIKSENEQLKKASTQHRRDIAELKRQVADLEKRVKFLETKEGKRATKKPNEKLAQGARFSPKWLKSHRGKLGISAADYAKLVGVTTLTVYNWEHGKSRPRQAQLASLVRVRDLGKREALRQLELID